MSLFALNKNTLIHCKEGLGTENHLTSTDFFLLLHQLILPNKNSSNLSKEDVLAHFQGIRKNHSATFTDQDWHIIQEKMRKIQDFNNQLIKATTRPKFNRSIYSAFSRPLGESKLRAPCTEESSNPPKKQRK